MSTGNPPDYNTGTYSIELTGGWKMHVDGIWLYNPSDESFYNSANLNAALARQFTNGVDDVNSELWINK
jgi:hypothetical protein